MIRPSLVPLLVAFGALLWLSRVVLNPSWASFGPSWGLSGPFRGALGVLSGCLGTPSQNQCFDWAFLGGTKVPQDASRLLKDSPFDRASWSVWVVFAWENLCSYNANMATEANLPK